MDFDSIESLRATEADCIRRFQAKMRTLRAENPGLSASILRAKAASLLPQTMERYLSACSRLTYTGQAPVTWK
jgi:hypothetical protein